MDSALWVGMLAAFSALAGAAIAQWGALRATELQSRHQIDRDKTQRSQALQDQEAAVTARKREEFLGLVLLAQNRMIDRLEQRHKFPSVPSGKSPSSAARQAYAVALLYLADMSPLAKTFYLASAKLQFALEDADIALCDLPSGAWVKSFTEIESALAK